MRRDKTLARVLLIFSISSVVLAAPALLRQRRLVTDRADGEPMDESEQAHGLLAEPEPGPSVGSPAGDLEDVSLSDSMLDWLDKFINSLSPLHQDMFPVSGASKSDSDVPQVSGGPGPHGVPSPAWWSQTTERPPAQFEVGETSSHMESGSPGGGGGLAPASGIQRGPLYNLNQAATRLGFLGSHGSAWLAEDIHVRRLFE